MGLIKDENFTITFHLSNDIPDEDFLVSYDASHFPEVNESIWYNTKAKIVPNPEPEEILSLIRSKEQKIDLYREKASCIYLLIVEGLIPISWYDSFKEVEN